MLERASSPLVLDARRKLLITDAQQCLSGLSFSLSRGSEGLAQALLHAHDLTDVLSTLGMTREVGWLMLLDLPLSRHQPEVIPILLELSKVLVLRLNFCIEGADDQVPALLDAFELFWQKQSLPLQQMAVDEIQTGTFAPPASEMAAQWTLPVPLTNHAQAALPEVDLRQKALVLIEEARIANGSEDPMRKLQVDDLLGQLQDWMSRLGQVRLDALYSRPVDQVAGITVDPRIFSVLEVLQGISAKCAAIHVQVRSLILFVDWMAVELSEQELNQVSDALKGVWGRMERNDHGWRLVMPTSLVRMRVLPMVIEGETKVISFAQFVECRDLNEGHLGGHQVLVKIGNQPKILVVEKVLTSQNMNIFETPLNENDAFIPCLALDGSGRAFQWVTV